MANPIELLISLGINDQESRKNIAQYIKNLKAENLDVTLNIESASSNNKVFTQMQKQIESLQKQIRELNSELDKVGKGSSSNSTSFSANISKDLSAAQEQIRKFIMQLGYTDFDFKIDTSVNTATGEKQLKQFTATIRDVNDEIRKLTFKPDIAGNGFVQVTESLKDTNLKDFTSSLVKVTSTLDEAQRKSQLASKEIEEYRRQIEAIEESPLELDKASAFERLNNSIKDTVNSTAQFNKVSNDFNQALLSIGRNGILGAERLDEFKQTVREIENSNLTLDEKVVKLRNELAKLNNEFANAKHVNAMSNAMEDAKRKVQDLESAFQKTVNTYKRETKNMDLSKWQNELKGLSSIPNFNTQLDIDDFNRKIKQAQSNLKEFNAQVTEANRGSLTFFDQLRVAMERFPIWMAASTAFYAITRGVQDLITKVIELDTAMVELQRVMDAPNYVFSDMLEQSIQNIDALSGKMSDYMALVNEFARMDFATTNEVLDMANTAQTLTNISDLNAEQSVDSLMAAITAYNIEAEKSIDIADKLNEVKC